MVRETPFYSFNNYLQSEFGQRVHRISLDAGFDCPNLDGNLSDSGCTFCNNKGFVTYHGKNKSVREQIQESIEFYKTHKQTIIALAERG